MIRISALVHVMAGIVLSGLFVMVIIYFAPLPDTPIWAVVAAAIAGWIVALPVSWWVAKRATTGEEERRLKERDRREFLDKSA